MSEQIQVTAKIVTTMVEKLVTVKEPVEAVELVMPLETARKLAAILGGTTWAINQDSGMNVLWNALSKDSMISGYKISPYKVVKG